MKRLFLIFGFCLVGLAASAADLKPGHVFFQSPPGLIEFTNADAQASVLKSFNLPVELMRGSRVLLLADLKARDVSAKPMPWNGIKLMMKVETPERTNWPQADIPVGAFDWRHFSTRVVIPENATAASLNLGLERVSGAVSFDHVQVLLRRSLQSAPPAPASQPIFRGHDLPRLCGAMVSPRLSEADLEVLADRWHGNLIRWQLIRSNERSGEPDPAGYDKWLEGMLVKTDEVLGWAKKHGVKVVLDLHSPPGGKASPGGYVAAMGEFFTQPEAQRHFVEVWQRMARRFKGNRVIWGFDLVNEPVDDQVSETCQDWQGLALTAGTAIREIDPERTLIVEPPQWGSPAGWDGFNPLPLPRVVYSFHMYEPSRFTHQRVFNKSQSAVAYPGNINGQEWNRDLLMKVVQPAINFASRYRVHMYVGEFSAIRWAPGAEKYLADVTSIFEEQGWDWSYHAFREWSGWSLEHGSDEHDNQPAAQPTARFQAIETWLQRNQRPTDP